MIKAIGQKSQNVYNYLFYTAQRYDQILITKNSKRICLENNDFVSRDLKSCLFVNTSFDSHWTTFCRLFSCKKNLQ